MPSSILHFLQLYIDCVYDVCRALQVAAMQRDSSTYLDEPSDGDDFSKWRSSFSLAAAQPQIDAILADNSFMAELHARIVPVVVEAEDFWLRYFYR